jgi:hypothetical protein
MTSFAARSRPIRPRPQLPELTVAVYGDCVVNRVHRLTEPCHRNAANTVATQLIPGGAAIHVVLLPLPDIRIRDYGDIRWSRQRSVQLAADAHQRPSQPPPLRRGCSPGWALSLVGTGRGFGATLIGARVTPISGLSTGGCGVPVRGHGFGPYPRPLDAGAGFCDTAGGGIGRGGDGRGGGGGGGAFSGGGAVVVGAGWALLDVGWAFVDGTTVVVDSPASGPGLRSSTSTMPDTAAVAAAAAISETRTGLVRYHGGGAGLNVQEPAYRRFWSKSPHEGSSACRTRS